MVAPNTTILQRMVESDAFAEFMKNYNLIFIVFLGVTTLTILALLCINISKLSVSADNDMRRRQAISGIFTCLVCLAVIGGIDTVYAILLSLVFNFTNVP